MKRFVAFITLVCMVLSCMTITVAHTDNTEFINIYKQDFEYQDNIGNSVSVLDNWSVDNENLDETTTGSTVKLAPSPDDSTDTVMHVKCIRNYNSMGVNQYAVYSPNADLSADYAIYTANYKIPDVKNDYVTYIKGNLTTADGKITEKNLSQLVAKNLVLLQTH